MIYFLVSCVVTGIYALLAYGMAKVLFGIKTNYKKLGVYLVVTSAINALWGSQEIFNGQFNIIFYSVFYTMSLTLLTNIKLKQAFLSIIFFNILSGTSELIAYLILVRGFHLALNTPTPKILLNMFYSLFADGITISAMIFLYKKKYGKLVSENALGWPHIFIGLILMLIFWLNCTLLGQFKDVLSARMFTATNIFIVISIGLLFLFFILINYDVSNKYVENENLYLRNETIEELANEQRRFRHDYINILQGLYGYIKFKDWHALEEYYAELMTEFGNTIINEKMTSLEKIKNLPLFGLVLGKINRAERLGINVELKVLGIIDDLPIRVWELVEVLGIYLDNAIEAVEHATDTGQKRLTIHFVAQENELSIVIENPCQDNVQLSSITKPGVSTKGSHRGLGLWIVGRTLAKYENVSVDTTIDKGVFRQELTVKSA